MAIFSDIYQGLISLRQYLYQFGIKKTHRLPGQVISIGNITMGGTGKTPATIALAQEAVTRGYRPCILTRGYKGIQHGMAFVSKGGVPLLSSHEAGDEPVLMAYKLTGVKIIKGKNRYLAGKIAGNDVDLFILDDGFQHLCLHRDIDVLLIDSMDPFGKRGRLFPEGRLREPLSAMKRADYIVLTKSSGKDNSELTKTIRYYNNNAPLYQAFHRPVYFVDRNWDHYDLTTIQGKRVFAFAGIAAPESFRGILTSLGAHIIRFKGFRDHYRYRQADVSRLLFESRGMKLITTEKDLVRMLHLDIPYDLRALSIEFVIDESFYNNLLNNKERKVK
jgi:tetraacyldisaccharide 4'-kinase